jgi:hypothetical protein
MLVLDMWFSTSSRVELSQDSVSHLVDKPLLHHQRIHGTGLNHRFKPDGSVEFSGRT